MRFEWSLREEILAIMHRWPLPMLAFLTGCLVGWGLSYVLPANYGAETTLYVGYNSDAIYRNPDDYKNWNLEQLNALAFAPDVLEATLHNLRNPASAPQISPPTEIDPYWNDVNKKQLQESLTLAWRNTGTWSFSARNDTARRASQAVAAWADVFLQKYYQAQQAADQALFLEKQLFPLNLALAQEKSRLASLAGLQQALLDWQVQASGSSETSRLSTTGVPALSRWRLYALASQAAGFDPGWMALLESFPPVVAPVSEYQAWLERALVSLQSEIDASQAQIDALEPQRLSAETSYAQAVEQSRGLSTTVVVEKNTEDPPKVAALRSSAQMALVGGLVGLLIWLFAWLARLSARWRR